MLKEEYTKILAMYLPQFHRIPENDLWWGKGFTEWTNVRRARPLFEGHLQPRTPIDGNYYDLSSDTVMINQMDMAKHYGIDVFCLYHYWFDGRCLLERPLEALLNHSNLPIDFCICWANEPWTRTWDGRTDSKEILVEQNYGLSAEWEDHFDYMSQFFGHNNYLRIKGMPVIVIYKASDIASRKEMYATWKKRAIKTGFRGLYIIEIHRQSYEIEVPYMGDAVMDFEPFATLSHLDEYELNNIRNEMMGFNGRRYAPMDYEVFSSYLIKRMGAYSPNHFAGYYPGWDNTPRHMDDTKILFWNNFPEVFGRYFQTLYRLSYMSGKEVLCINAWNEWGEGAFLEPDEIYGYRYLEEIKKAKEAVIGRL